VHPVIRSIYGLVADPQLQKAVPPPYPGFIIVYNQHVQSAIVAGRGQKLAHGLNALPCLTADFHCYINGHVLLPKKML
jgi:hypothetical protein